MQIQHGLKVVDFVSLLYSYLTEKEGKRLIVYKDHKGNPTVGIGHKVVAGDRLKVGQSITEAQCSRFFMLDYERLNIGQWANDKATWEGNQRLAVASFVWSHGDGQYRSSQLRQYLLNDKPKADTLAYLRKTWDVNSAPNQRRNEADISLFYSAIPYNFTGGFFLGRQSMAQAGYSLRGWLGLR